MATITQSAKTAIAHIADFLPANSFMWIAVLCCVIILVAFSRLLSMQSSIQELQTRPPIDEGVIRGVVRQQLEETVRAIDQQNKAQMMVHSQRAHEAARAAFKPVIVEEIKTKAEPEPKAELTPEPIEPQLPKPEHIEPQLPKPEHIEVVEPEPLKLFDLDERLDEMPKARKRKSQA